MNQVAAVTSPSPIELSDCRVTTHMTGRIELDFSNLPLSGLLKLRNAYPGMHETHCMTWERASQSFAHAVEGHLVSKDGLNKGEVTARAHSDAFMITVHYTGVQKIFVVRYAVEMFLNRCGISYY